MTEYESESSQFENKQLMSLMRERVEEYEHLFGELTFSTVLMTPRQIIEEIDKALASGKPYYDDYPEDAII
jgi:hypothetical protein